MNKLVRTGYFIGLFIFSNSTLLAQSISYPKKYASTTDADVRVGFEIGDMAPNFTQKNQYGTYVSLNDFRGKYVLIDFWASWCKPCRVENPKTVRSYNTFKNKNFSILGVSLDQTESDWKNAITDDNLTWAHVSDLKAWQNAVAVKYKVESIPASFLINPSGIIIAKGLRGDDLYNKLAEVLGKPEVVITTPAKTNTEDNALKLVYGKFFDDFSDNKNDWDLSGSNNYSAYLTNGKLKMKGISANFSYSINKQFSINTNENFSISVITKWSEGTTSSGFGLNFCSNPSTTSYYTFFINAAGSYAIKYLDGGGDWKVIKDWKPSSYINQNSVPNIVTIKKEGNYINFYVNDTKLESYPFDGGYGNYFGCRIGNIQTVEFDNLTITGTNK